MGEWWSPDAPPSPLRPWRPGPTTAVMPAWVLVIDGSVADAMVLFGLLEQEGHRATVIHDGAEGLDLLRAEPFDLAVVDLSARVLGATDFVATARRDTALVDLPLIVTAPASETARLLRCLELGAHDYLPKPIEPLVVRIRVRTALAAKRFDELVCGLQRLALVAPDIGTGDSVAGELDAVRRRGDPLALLSEALLDLHRRFYAGPRPATPADSSRRQAQ